jgi:hypothetical protein
MEGFLFLSSNVIHSEVWNLGLCVMSRDVASSTSNYGLFAAVEGAGAAHFASEVTRLLAPMCDHSG